MTFCYFVALRPQIPRNLRTGAQYPDRQQHEWHKLLSTGASYFHSPSYRSASTIPEHLADLQCTESTTESQTMAGTISLLNDYLILSGPSPLALLNPWLYSYAREGLDDITYGSNPGCGTQGFRATDG